MPTFTEPSGSAPGQGSALGEGSAEGDGSVQSDSGAQGSGGVQAAYRLLAADEPAPVIELNLEGKSPFIILVDHAGRSIPRRLGDLGLPATELLRHIAWDIGAFEVAKRMAVALDAPLLAQHYSRLVIDCNRDPEVPSSIPTSSEWIDIPGNLNLSAAEIDARRVEIFEPYHGRVRALLDARQASGRPTILVAQHSMTHEYKGVRRMMHAAVLYNRDRRFAGAVLDALRVEPGLIIGDNEPYFVSDESDYSVPRHAEARGLKHVEVEIRQDLIGHSAGQDEWGERMVRVLRAAERKMDAEPQR
jgi:predicted N-formylglutamate amidohydrolase